MNKKILIIILATLPFSLIAQNTVKLNPQKLSQIILPSNIEKIKAGFNTDYFSIEVYNNILYLQPIIDDIEKSNVSIITKDGLIYLIDLVVSKDATQSSYIIPDSVAINYRKKDNILKSNKEVMKINNLIDKKSDWSFILSQSNSIHHGGARNQNVEFYVKGIYVDSVDNIYFKMELNNLSPIDYKISAIFFNVKNKKKSKKSTIDDYQLQPTDNNKITKVSSDRKEILIFKFSRFTIDKNKSIVINIIEEGGERGINYKLDNKVLYDSIKI